MSPMLPCLLSSLSLYDLPNPEDFMILSQCPQSISPSRLGVESPVEWVLIRSDPVVPVTILFRHTDSNRSSDQTKKYRTTTVPRVL